MTTKDQEHEASSNKKIVVFENGKKKEDTTSGTRKVKAYRSQDAMTIGEIIRQKKALEEKDAR